MDVQTLHLEEHGCIAIITMDNPQTLNALSDIAVKDLHTALDIVEANPYIRVVILTGTGRAFVSGADISYRQHLTAAKACAFSYRTGSVYQRIIASERIFIAALNGLALGGGCELALACDLRIAAETAKLGLPEVKLGIIPGGGGTQRLPLAVGYQRACEMILTGQPISAERALEIGLVCRVTPADRLMEEAMTVATAIAMNSPVAVAYAKASLRAAADASPQGIAYENKLFGLCFAHADQQEGMTAFLEKRKAKFSTSLDK